MLILPAADTIAGVASAANEVTCTLFLMELAGTTETYTKDQQQLASSVATIYTVPGSTITEVRGISVVNTDHSNANTFQLFAGGTAAANAITPLINLPPGGLAQYTDEGGWSVLDAVGGLLIDGNFDQKTWMGGTVSGTSLILDVSSPKSTTGKRVLALNLPQAGTYRFQFYISHNSNDSAHGSSFGINYTGGVTSIAGWWEYPATGTTASTGAHSMTATAAAGQIHESFGFRAVSTTSPNMGATVSTDAAPNNMLSLLRGTLIAATGGALELWHGGEAVSYTAGPSVMRGTSLIVTRFA